MFLMTRQPLMLGLCSCLTLMFTYFINLASLVWNDNPFVSDQQKDDGILKKHILLWVLVPSLRLYETAALDAPKRRNCAWKGSCRCTFYICWQETLQPPLNYL